MSIYFIDTSSLGKRYIQETGSSRLRNLLDPKEHNICIISELTLVETISMFEKYTRMNLISNSISGMLRYQFLKHAREEYLVVPINTKIMTTARNLLVKHRKHSLRALDAIQLSTAVELKKIFTQPLTFVASDTKLTNAATSEGFPTDNPLLHP